MKKAIIIILILIGITKVTHAQTVPNFVNHNKGYYKNDQKSTIKAKTNYAHFIDTISDPTQKTALQKTSNAINPGATIKELRTQIDSVPYNDSATLAYLNDLIKAKKDSITGAFLTKDKPPIGFEIWNIGKFDVDTLNNYFYYQNKVDAFQNVSVQGTIDPGTFINSEVGSFLFGPVRMGVGGSFKTKGDTTQDNAIKSSIQKIISNGGSISLNFIMPILYFRNKSEFSHFGLYAQCINGFNPNIDTTGKNVRTDFSTDILYSNQSGLFIYTDLNSNDQKAKISFQVSGDYFWGSKSLYSTLGLSDFFEAKIQIGVVLANLLTLQFAGPLYSTSATIQKVPFTMSLQFSPSQALKKN